MVKKSLAISFIIIILISNMGFTLATHFCGDQLVMSSIGIGNEVLGCGMTQEEDGTCNSENHQESDSVQQNECCKNEFTTFSIEDGFSSSSDKVKNEINANFLVVFVVAFLNQYVLEQDTDQFFIEHLPPDKKRDRSVLFQVFRI